MSLPKCDFQRGACRVIAISCLALGALVASGCSVGAPDERKSTSSVAADGARSVPKHPADQAAKMRFIARSEQICADARDQLKAVADGVSRGETDGSEWVTQIIRILEQRTSDVLAQGVPRQDEPLLREIVADERKGLRANLSDATRANLRARLNRRARSYGFDGCWRELEDLVKPSATDDGPRQLDAKSLARAVNRVGQIWKGICDRVDIQLASAALGFPPHQLGCVSSGRGREWRYPPAILVSYSQPHDEYQGPSPPISVELKPLATPRQALNIGFLSAGGVSSSPPVPSARTLLLQAENPGDKMLAVIQRPEDNGNVAEVHVMARLNEGQDAEAAAEAVFEMARAYFTLLSRGT